MFWVVRLLPSEGGVPQSQAEPRFMLLHGWHRVQHPPCSIFGLSLLAISGCWGEGASNPAWPPLNHSSRWV